jgi:hypothetical protein
LIRLLAIQTGLLSGAGSRRERGGKPWRRCCGPLRRPLGRGNGDRKAVFRPPRLRALSWRGAWALKQTLITSAKETSRTRLSAALRQVGQTRDPATGRAILGPALGEVLPASADGRLPARRPDDFRSVSRVGGERSSVRLARLRVPDGPGEAGRSRRGPARPTGSAAAAVERVTAGARGREICKSTVRSVDARSRFVGRDYQRPFAVRGSWALPQATGGRTI